MSEVTFPILNYSQSVKINESDISADHDALYAYLNIPLNFTLRTLSDENAFDLLPINARLFTGNPPQLLSDHMGSRALSLHSREFSPGYFMKFALNDAALHYLEKNRNGDIQLAVELYINASIKTSIQKATGRRSFSNDYIQNETITINFKIARSQWVETILPKLGFRNLKLIEIPLSHDNLKEPYADIILEFNKAEKYFNSHDYNKCVAHCRHTLDALTRNLRSFKNDSKSETGFKWLQTVGKETLTWLDELNKSTSAITSKTHHSGQKIDFSRQEAESIYLIVLGLLNYVGSLTN
jgi:hypothetical protein